MQSLEAATTAERRQGKITAIASSAIHPSFHLQDEFTIADYLFLASVCPPSVAKARFCRENPPAASGVGGSNIAVQ